MKNDSGFGIYLVLLTIVFAVLAAAAGIIVYRAQQSSRVNVATTADTTPSESTVSETSKPSDKVELAASSEAKQTVDISEWGIKLELDDADKVTYKLGSDNSGVQFAQLYLKDSVSAVCQNLGIYAKRSDTAQGMDDIKIGSYYYRVGGGPGACDDDPGGVNGSINQLRLKIIHENIVFAEL